ncbi:hypothetical protein KL86DPRO_20102 [uncultured delta proteobacterium]|uniref:Hemerythrin-like metal-binding protein n=1 Tax=uncultured delta proteobacterium TaxID=34034 RepID=A0A212JUX4_9DELT|nr:hypothetical protein KL86DPRO_20102 [uncultured delta proteobacterium]
MVNKKYAGNHNMMNDRDDACDMMLIFREKYETGISIIDDQHKGLMGAINTLLYHMRRHDRGAVALPALLAFRSYAGIHCCTEKMVLEFNEPGYAALYDMQHEELRAYLLKAESLFHLDTYPQHFLLYLKAWWLAHLDNHREFFMPVEESGNIPQLLAGTWVDKGGIGSRKPRMV